MTVAHAGRRRASPRSGGPEKDQDLDDGLEGQHPDGVPGFDP